MHTRTLSSIVSLGLAIGFGLVAAGCSDDGGAEPTTDAALVADAAASDGVAPTVTIDASSNVVVDSGTSQGPPQNGDAGPPKPPMMGDGGHPGDGGGPGNGGGGFGKPCTDNSSCPTEFPSCEEFPDNMKHCTIACTPQNASTVCPSSSSGCSPKGFCKLH